MDNLVTKVLARPGIHILDLPLSPERNYFDKSPLFDKSCYHTEKDHKLYCEGKLGVAVSVGILMQNIQRMTDNPEIYFLKQNLGRILDNPALAGSYYDMGYLPECGEERLEVTVKGSGTLGQMEERAQRNLAYKILTRKATHSVDYRVERNDDSVTLRATPVILTRGM